MLENIVWRSAVQNSAKCLLPYSMVCIMSSVDKATEKTKAADKTILNQN
jgi:hypothetical protein